MVAKAVCSAISNYTYNILHKIAQGSRFLLILKKYIYRQFFFCKPVFKIDRKKVSGAFDNLTEENKRDKDE
jgi:hypothetical protein